MLGKLVESPWKGIERVNEESMRREAV